MKNIFFILIVFIFVTTPGCKKDDITVADNSNLTGQWQWQYSEGGLAFHKIKAENNSVLLLNFNPDSSFYVTETGKPPLKGNYYVTGDTTSVKVIHFNSDQFGDPTGEAYTIENNQLILTDYMISDGFRHYYERVK